MWTRFMDMHSGGVQKEKWAYIYIEAPEDEAKLIFYNRFGHNPKRVTCTCCGDDYSISSDTSLAQLTAFDRGCAYDTAKNVYVEKSDGKAYRPYKRLSAYKVDNTILFISKAQIADSERHGSIPEQGYVWVD